MNDKYMVTNQGIQNLAAAIVQKAVDDWRGLCRGATTESATCNFDELRRFFRRDAGFYLRNDDLAVEILRRLEQERVKTLAKHVRPRKKYRTREMFT